jgi:hypothetical protein
MLRPESPFFGEYEDLAIEVYNKYAEVPETSGRNMLTYASMIFFLKEIKALRDKLGIMEIPYGYITPPLAYLDGIPEGWQVCDGTNGTPDLRHLSEKRLMKMREKK